jgi:hypothetical protein
MDNNSIIEKFRHPGADPAWARRAESRRKGQRESAYKGGVVRERAVSFMRMNAGFARRLFSLANESKMIDKRQGRQRTRPARQAQNVRAYWKEQSHQKS